MAVGQLESAVHPAYGLSAAFADEVTVLRVLLREGERDPEAFPIGKRVYIAIDWDRPRAGKRLAEWFAAFSGRPQMASQTYSPTLSTSCAPPHPHPLRGLGGEGTETPALEGEGWGEGGASVRAFYPG